MIKKLVVYRNHEELERHDREFWRSKTPDDRIDMVEILRIEAGKMLNYEYPTRLRRIIKIIRKI